MGNFPNFLLIFSHTSHSPNDSRFFSVYLNWPSIFNNCGQKCLKFVITNHHWLRRILKKSFFVGWLVPVRGDEAKYRCFWQRRQQIAWLPAIYLKIWEFLLKFSRFGLTSLKGNFAMNGVCRLSLTFCRLIWWTIFVSLIDFFKFFEIFYFLDEKNSFFSGIFIYCGQKSTIWTPFLKFSRFGLCLEEGT